MRSEVKKLSGFFEKSVKEEMLSSSVKSGGDQLIKINNRFFLTTTKYSHQYYNAYNGIDIKDGKWIVAYLKLVPIMPRRALSNSASPARSRNSSAIPSTPGLYGTAPFKSTKRPTW